MFIIQSQVGAIPVFSRLSKETEADIAEQVFSLSFEWAKQR